MKRFLLAFIAVLSLGAIGAYADVIGIFGNGIPAAPSVYGQIDSSAGLYFGTKRVGVAQHLESGVTGADVPAVSSCGTGALTTGSTDTAGEVTATGATSCTLTWGTAFTAVPSCVGTDESTAAGLKLATTATTTVVTGLTSGDKFAYVCIAKSGG